MSKNKKFQKALKQEKGITLIALVITIVILIILATVAVSYVFGENGLIGYADKAKDVAEADSQEEGKELTNMTSYLNELMGGKNEEEEPSGEAPKVEDVKGGEAFEEKTKVVDSKNNEIWIPEGFKIASDSGDTVQQGIVIEDVSASNDTAVQGSQYVWIPVGTFTKDDGSTSRQIILGRYTFDTSGNPTLVQDAANYTDQSESVVIKSYHSELSTYRVGVASYGKDGENATSKDLKGFIDSVSSNGGYYIGRYEASYASGSSTANYKAASKESNGYSKDSMSYNARTLWNFITQLDASKVAINTYVGSSSVKSDLINSYAWDTAIVYIQEAENSDYANQNGYSINTSLANTGTNGDEVCKINDMSSNVREWTTEYSSNTVSNRAYPCTNRGGVFSTNFGYTAYRVYRSATDSRNDIGFRLSLYL